MNEDWVTFWIIFIPFLIVCIFGIGWCIGNDSTIKSIRQEICKTIMQNTNDYINCNTKNINEIIKGLSNSELDSNK